jgi:hypothetical protein
LIAGNAERRRANREWYTMFTAGALLLTTAIMWFASKMNDRDRSMYDRATPDDRVWILVLHVRQDLKLIAFLLAGTMIMLGVIADRIG